MVAPQKRYDTDIHGEKKECHRELFFLYSSVELCEMSMPGLFPQMNVDI